MDPIADFISQLKNAVMARKQKVIVPYSKFKHNIAEALQRNGYIYSASKKGRKEKKMLEVELYEPEFQARPLLRDTKRTSKPSRRVYKGVRDVYAQRSGTSVISTPKGVLTAEEARKQNVGGEELFHIW